MAKITKSELLDVAKNVINEKGIDRASLREIAKTANVSTGAIYHYFPSKEALLYDVMSESLSVTSKVADDTHLEMESRETICKEIHENIVDRFSKENENRLQFFLLKEALLGNDDLKVDFEEKYEEWVSKTQKLLRHLYKEIDEKHERAIASLLIGAIDGIALQLMLNEDTVDVNAVGDVYKYLLDEGFIHILSYFGKGKDQ